MFIYYTTQDTAQLLGRSSEFRLISLLITKYVSNNYQKSLSPVFPFPSDHLHNCSSLISICTQGNCLDNPLVFEDHPDRSLTNKNFNKNREIGLQPII